MPPVSSTPRVAGRSLMAFVRLLRSPLGDRLRRLLAARLVRRLTQAQLDAPPAFLEDRR
jgi:hypothetical protein